MERIFQIIHLFINMQINGMRKRIAKNVKKSNSLNK